MAGWNEIIDRLNALNSNPSAIYDFLHTTLDNALIDISKLRENRNVIFYASAFLQKPLLDPMSLQITNEEINSFMAVMHGMNFNKNLTLVLHTPGGVTNSTETIVDYLHSKFNYTEVIVPTFAMSAGTMMALSADKIVMGRPSQLGPIDPQMIISGKSVSARSIVDQFEKAKKEIHENVINAHVWAPILASMGPGLLIEAEKANDYSEAMVKNWLEKKGNPKAKEIAAFFNEPSLHKSHGKRIDRDTAKEQGVIIEDLENDQKLQEAVMTAYHAITILFEKSPASKIVVSNNNRKRWIKNVIVQQTLNFPIQQPQKVK